jgi:probable phosphoglycerate mutase
MSFGSWEDLTLAEASVEDPALFEAIFRRGEDLPRGGDGESFAEAGDRFRATLDALVARNGHRSMGVVSHGAVIRAFTVGLAGLTFPERNRIPVPRNSAMSRFVFTQQGPALAAYNVAPHLDR